MNRWYGLVPIVLISVFLFIFPVFKKNQQVSGACDNVVAEKIISMQSAFKPDSATIKKCTKVIFKNVDTQSHWPASNLHPTHGIYPEFDPQQEVNPGKEWSFVFDRIGKWRYHDHLHPSILGTIIVEK